jgi:hypothetical protein
MIDILTPPAAPEITQAERIARSIEADVRTLTEDIAKRWRASWAKLWQPEAGVTSNDILAAMGGNAGRVFEMSSGVVTLLLTVAQTRTDIVESLMARLEQIPAFDRHDDGTITLAEIFPAPIVVAEPEPEGGE